ncbi:MAG: cysteine hydrolase family protein [Liquorilactobacillus mali]|uniref:cysteine hydrolase family protein n=1 Tax=Liquorilactobacillus mali TaxID=1618 RepID=UPI0039E85562
MPLADALLTIDFQNGVCKGPTPVVDLENCIYKINKRIALYRQSEKPIIFVQHNDNELVKDQRDWLIINELNTKNDDYYVQKRHANSFYKTTLKTILDENTVNTIEICGAQTEYCVDTTIKMAHGLGYKLQMVRGTATTIANDYMDAKTTNLFYENIWNHRFLGFV